MHRQLGIYPAAEDYKKAVEAKEKELAAECDGSMRDFVKKIHTIGVRRAFCRLC